MQLSGTLIEKGVQAFAHEPHNHQGILVPRVWIVVADVGSARVYRKRAYDMELIAEARADHQTGDHGSGLLNHGSDMRSKLHHHQGAIFTFNLANWLDECLREKAFDRLVLVAPPHMMGDLRKASSHGLRACTVTEVDKDMIKLTEKEIHDHLCDLIWF